MTPKLQAALLVAALALICGIDAALAQDGYVGLEQRLTPAQLREVGLTPAQVALLDRYLREADAAAPPPPAVQATPAEGAGRGAGSLIGLDEGPIRARLKGRVAGWEPGTVFALDNGQQWKVLKGQMTLREPLETPEVLLVPGIAGRWFLQVDEDLPKARVYRID